MTSLTFYGGVNEIGGNKILLQDKDTKVFLDFGKSFSRRATYFEEYLNPRTSNGIVDFLTMGLVPDISGVYRDDLMVMAGRKPEEPDIDAVLLTHAHADPVLRREALQADAPYLVKPISPDVLLRTVEALLPPLLGRVTVAPTPRFD